MTSHSEIVNSYKEKLPPHLRKLYERLAIERRNISYYGYLLGFILSLLIIYYKLKVSGRNSLSLVCLVTSTCFLTNYFYYILSPKSDWMLNHINNQYQARIWLEMYREMQFNYHMGIVLGIMAVAMLAFSFRC
uniref:Uncharacterized protein n=1 Tax=viral metagenome TaxID=1070528 RepID=A0A6C0LM70_9ZZZZ